MKNLLFIMVLSILSNSCSTTNKMANEAIHHAIVGQNYKTLCSRLGAPMRIVPDSDGGKIMIYEYYSKGMFTKPYESELTFTYNNAGNRNSPGVTLSSDVNTTTNNPQYTIYEKNTSYLKVFLNKQGNCVRFEQNLPKEKLEYYHGRFKHFLPKD